ncbi:hypothetical protein DQ04_04121030 [Trypanosoma grayi]|uniref:hypothetical protein n=1 Tax=Trypanosoma grayi TaxID=71804 RepID=UPI0004F45C81|nr:hypothetical protein DQ04_04121030 [Trypanosoma grayi]KEG10145.1 hypothetical protein DQ04_04121030 [Trypanosoma grayi]
MGSRDELVTQFTTMLAEIEWLQPSPKEMIDADILSAVADYIEVGSGGEATLKRLRDALLHRQNHATAAATTTNAGKNVVKAPAASAAPVQEQQPSPANAAEEMGRKRAQKILVQQLLLRYNQ